MRKPRSDSKLLNLPEEQRAEILDLLESGISYHAARPVIAKQFGVSSSPSSLSAFYSQEKAKRVIAQRLRSLSVAQQISQEASERPSMFNAAMIEQISQLAFELSIQSSADPAVVKQFFDMVLKARQQEIDVRKVAIIEEKARLADQAGKVANNSDLSAEEKDRRMRQIFGAA